MTIKLTDAQRDLLTLNAEARAGELLVSRGSAFQALRRRGLVEPDGTVTDTGREAIGLPPIAAANAIAALDAIPADDPEIACIMAIGVVLDLVHPGVREAFKRAEQRVGWHFS